MATDQDSTRRELIAQRCRLSYTNNYHIKREAPARVTAWRVQFGRRRLVRAVCRAGSKGFSTYSVGMHAYMEFRGNFSKLFTKLRRLECELRSIGSGGWAMVAQRDLRKSLERVMLLYGSYLFIFVCHDEEIRDEMAYLVVPEDLKEKTMDFGRLAEDYVASFRILMDAVNGFKDEVYGFLGKYYNDCLMRVLCKMNVVIEDFVYHELTLPKDQASHQLNRKAIEDIFSEVNRMMPILGREIDRTVNEGIPLIRIMQKQHISRNLNMTMVATFFAGVTVAIMQYTYQTTNTTIAVVINTLLFWSLISSIASAAQSLLVLTWRQSPVPTPESLQYPFLSDWLLNGPTSYITLAGLLFSIALCLFAFSSGQRQVTGISAAVLSGFYAIVLLGFWCYFIKHHWDLSRRGGLIGVKLTMSMLTIRLIEWIVRPFRSKQLPTPSENSLKNGDMRARVQASSLVESGRVDGFTAANTGPSQLASYLALEMSPIPPIPTRPSTAASSTTGQSYISKEVKASSYQEKKPLELSSNNVEEILRVRRNRA